MLRLSQEKLRNDFFDKLIWIETIRPLTRFKRDLALHHFTPDAQTVVGIVATGHIHATDLSFMNDRSELLYAHSVIDDVLRRRHTIAVGMFRDVLKSVREHLNAFGMNFPVFAACFCEGESVSQWQNYARNRGYDLVFAAYPIVYKRRSNHWLCRIEYSPARQKTLVSDSIDISHRVLLDAASNRHVRMLDDETKVRSVAKALSYALVTIAPGMKDPRFRNEKEWRLLQFPGPTDPEDLQFRTVGSSLTPYVAMRIRSRDRQASSLPLEEVRILKSDDGGSRLRALRLLLNQYGLFGTKLIESPIPLRT